MQIEVLVDAEDVAKAAADILAEHCCAAVAERDAFSLAVSGGTTPWRMLRRFAAMDMAWPPGRRPERSG